MLAHSVRKGGIPRTPPTWESLPELSREPRRARVRRLRPHRPRHLHLRRSLLRRYLRRLPPRFLFFFFEVARVPEFVVDSVVGDGAGVDDDGFVNVGFEFHVAEINGGGLQGVEQEAGHFGFELAGEDEAHDLHEGDLDGVGVLEDGQGEGEVVGQLGVQLNALALPVFMQEAEAASAKSRGTALGAVGFDMSAARDMNGIHEDKCSLPSPWSCGISELRVGRGQNL